MILPVPAACFFLVAVGIHGRNLPPAEQTSAGVMVLHYCQKYNDSGSMQSPTSRVGKGNPMCTALRVTLKVIKEGYHAYVSAYIAYICID